MLLRLKIKNFLSFYEETVFDMFPNPKRESFQNHIYSDYEVPILKQAAIYGANASGKSNFIAALGLIKKITTQEKWHEGFQATKNKFCLASEENNEPIFFSIEFYMDKKYFIYEITINNNGIDEKLILSGVGKRGNEVIFEKTGSEISSKYENTNQEIKNAGRKLLEDNPLTSLLFIVENSMFPFFKDDTLIKIAQKWFKESFEVLNVHRFAPMLIEALSKNANLLSYYNHISKEIGLGINNIYIKQAKLSELLSSQEEDSKTTKDAILSRIGSIGEHIQFQKDKILYSISKDNDGVDIIKRLFFQQIGLNGYLGDLPFERQSDGTAKILNLLPAFYDIANKEKVFIIDEIENSIHPTLMINLMKFFGQSKTKGQLIFTTHESNLLNQQEIMRPDEVWFTEKENGTSKMYSLNDFKIHNTINIRNGYLEGRYGAIPFIGDLSTFSGDE